MNLQWLELMSATDNKRLYYSSMSELAYVENGHGIPLSEFPNPCIMVFDLTSTQEVAHDFIHPELQIHHCLLISSSMQR